VPAPTRTAPASDNSNDLKSLVRGLKDEAEMQAIKRALEQTKWKRKEAAELLHISYKALLYKIRQYGIDPARQSNSLPTPPVEQPAEKAMHAAASPAKPRMTMGDHSSHAYAES
jgi:hypothetical protein